MQQEAQALVGTHDFGAFAASGSVVKDTVRTIYRADIFRDGEEIKLIVEGNGFLYNMVRIIAGTLLKVGGGHILPEEIENIIAGKDRALAGPTAPAKGLTPVGREAEPPEGCTGLLMG